MLQLVSSCICDQQHIGLVSPFCLLWPGDEMKREDGWRDVGREKTNTQTSHTLVTEERHHTTLQQASGGLGAPPSCEHQITHRPLCCLLKTSASCIKSVSARRHFSLFYRRIVTVAAVGAFTLSVDERADRASCFCPVGSWGKHLLITARKSLEVCASLRRWVQLHSVQGRNGKICCCAQRHTQGRAWHLLTLSFSF